MYYIYIYDKIQDGWLRSRLTFYFTKYHKRETWIEKEIHEPRHLPVCFNTISGSVFDTKSTARNTKLRFVAAQTGAHSYMKKFFSSSLSIASPSFCVANYCLQEGSGRWVLFKFNIY